MEQFISASNFADIMGVSKATLLKWEVSGLYVPKIIRNKEKIFDIQHLIHIPAIKEMVESNWEQELQTKPIRPYTSIELFAGAGGLAIGLERAGFSHVMLNEIDHNACETLRTNRPHWNIMEQDIRQVDFTPYRDKIDFISGGFPCQAFSFAGKQGGFNDTRGTLFFELARAIKEIQPKVFLGENVKGLTTHDQGRTLQTIKNAIKELGYTLIDPRVLKAIKYQVPQKRERLLLVGIRNDIAPSVTFHWPSPYHRVMTLEDAFFKGELFDTDVPFSEGQKYPPNKQKILELVPMGGDWRNLPINIQKQYMGGSFLLGGGKTGMARRLSLKEPSLTLTCAPAQKQTERCHPIETRPLSVREYARIQTFPDTWDFSGSMSSKYKQIGNAVPVNLAYAIGRSLIRLLNNIENTDKNNK
ncbi:MAG: DNA (cytosine-5-)-methyltransferase [Anaerovoracaceae bacterium]